MINSAAQLWSRWIKEKLIRPQDYDLDISDAILQRLDQSGKNSDQLTESLESSNWSARDLIRALYPMLTSFSSMLTDLLELYSRIAAKRTDSESLSIEYEFESGDRIDDQLSSFARMVERVQHVIREIDNINFPDVIGVAWDSPLGEIEGSRKTNKTLIDEAVRFLGLENRDSLSYWPFASEVFVPVLPNTGYPGQLQRTVNLHREVIMGILQQYMKYGADLDSYLNYSGVLEGADRDIFFSATDHWAPQQIALLNLLPELISGLNQSEAIKLLSDQENWLKKFIVQKSFTAEQLIQEIENILLLPHWGRRHELYSTWLTTVMDKALDARLEFDITDGVLAFPFRATLLARMSTEKGQVELWTEKRFRATGQLGGGRKAGIQPDYVFIDAIAPHDVLVAVEAKQYLRANSANPGEAARDYARNLPKATVFIAAHGPIGPTAIDYVGEADRPRVHLCWHLRPQQPRSIKEFSQGLRDVLLLLPPQPLEKSLMVEPAQTIEQWIRPWSDYAGAVSLVWDPSVSDLDLHLLSVTTADDVTYSRLGSSHAQMYGDGFNGGPEVAVLYQSIGPINIEVHLFSNDVESVSMANPRIIIATTKVQMVLVPNLNDSPARIWRVGTIKPSGQITLGDSKLY